jgi:hypothetical protein
MRTLGNAGLVHPFRDTVTVAGRRLPIDVLIRIPVLATTGAARAVTEWRFRLARHGSIVDVGRWSFVIGRCGFIGCVFRG